MKISKRSVQYSHGLTYEVHCEFTHNTKHYKFFSWDHSEEKALRGCLEGVEDLIAELRVLQGKLEDSLLAVVEAF